MEHLHHDEWVEAGVAPDQVIAEMWQEFLRENRIPARLEPGDVVSFLGVSGMPVRLLVPEQHLDEARVLLDDFESAEIDPETLAAEAEAAAPEAGEAELIEAIEAELEAEGEAEAEADDRRG